jgi:glucokinase
MSESKDDRIIGIDVGGTKILAAVIDWNGRVLSRSKRDTLPHEVQARQTDPDLITERIVRTAREAVAEAGLEISDVAAVGAAVPGPVNVHTGRVLLAPNLPGWEQGYDVGPELEKRLERPVFIDNDVNLATLGEAIYGAGRDVCDLVGIFIGTGIGGGIILDGKLRHGRRWSAGEVGHMTILRNGPVCCCGIKGHADCFAGGAPIRRRLEKAAQTGESPILRDILTQQGEDAGTSSIILQALEAGDEITQRILADAQDVLGLLIADIVNMLDPECIVIGGGMVKRLENLGVPFLQPVREIAYAYFFQKEDVEQVKIVLAELGADAVILGCAILAQRLCDPGLDSPGR